MRSYLFHTVQTYSQIVWHGLARACCIHAAMLAVKGLKEHAHAGPRSGHRRLDLGALKAFGGLREVLRSLREARSPEGRRNFTWILLQGCAALAIQA